MPPAEQERRGWLPRRTSFALRPGEALRIVSRLTEGAPLDLRLVGRTILHAAAVGLVAGLIGAAFFAALELGQRVLLEGFGGLTVLRAQGERFVPAVEPPRLRLWVLALLPALGGLASGILTSWLAPEAAGGGGDATIDAYHRGGVLRRRVIPVKAAASILVLSTGGSGGREGPTMQIGAAIGAAVGRLLPTSRTERRVLVVAGVAAGMSAVFRTPLGAALLATEMMYRDDFEAEALVPAILSSVVAYSLVIALFGETTLFGRLPRFPFAPAHLPLYVALALAVALAGIAFEKAIRAVQRAMPRLGLRRWAAPAVGGLLMGCVGAALAAWMQSRHGSAARGFGVFGGGYGVLQAAMSGVSWSGGVRSTVLLLLGVAVAKLAASALTIGSGGSAGDFAPSLVIGGLLGAAFGYGAQGLLHDPTIQPAAFALVGMGTFYGGLAHTPLSALVLVAELAGSYDLLVPMMLSIGIAYVALRHHTLYSAQLPSRLASAVHGGGATAAALIEALSTRTAIDLLVAPELGPVDERASLEAIAADAEAAERQSVVAVRGEGGFSGLLELSVLGGIPPAERQWLRAHDARVPFAAVREDTTWEGVARALERCGVSQVPVLRGDDIVGWVGDRELRRAVAR